MIYPEGAVDDLEPKDLPKTLPVPHCHLSDMTLQAQSLNVSETKSSMTNLVHS